MDSEELLKEIKKDLYLEIDVLKRQHMDFKKRVIVCSNLIIPGLGYFIHGSSYFKGIISFVLFYAYNLFFFFLIMNFVDTATAIILYIPAVAIWIGSASHVSRLSE